LNSAHFHGSTTTVGAPITQLSFVHPSHLDQFGTHLAVYNKFFMYSTLNIFIICNWFGCIYN